jgi:hypothetical protein
MSSESERAFLPVIAGLAILAAIIGWLVSTSTQPDAAANGRLGVDPAEEPSAFRDSLRFRQVDLLESDDDEIESLLLPGQEIKARARPNLTYVDIIITGPDEAEAIATTDALMAYLIERNQLERREGADASIAELEVLQTQQESELVKLDGAADDVSIANRQGLVDAVADTRTSLEGFRASSASTNSALEIVAFGRGTSEGGQAWIAAATAFVGVILAGMALVSVLPVGQGSRRSTRG